MVWDFTFSFWIINGAYISNYNASLYTEPKIIEIDDCGPADLISAGFALWLVLVPAVACVVQLPGSLILFQRSNFYRFSPELGLVDTLAVISLLIKALWKGYRWDESIAAVFTVRDGIGQGDLWWRKDLETMFPADDGHPVTTVDQDQELAAIPSAQNQDSTSEGAGDGENAGEVTRPDDDSATSEDRIRSYLNSAGISGDQNQDPTSEDAEDNETAEEGPPPVNDDDSDTPDDRIRDFLNSKLAPRLEPLSQERVLGAGLFLIALLKIIAMLRVSSNGGVQLGCSLALAYSISYMVLEFLTWSYVFPLRNNSLRNVPPENLLDVIKYVDPGNNPFTFPSDQDAEPHTTSIQLTTIPPPSSTPSESIRSRVFRSYPVSTKYPWNKSIAIITATLGILGPFLWLVILSNIFDPARGAVILAGSAITFLVLRLGGKWAYHVLRQVDFKPAITSGEIVSPQTHRSNTGSTTDPERASTTAAPISSRDPYIQYNTHGLVHFFALWLWRRVTVVNLYSAIWIAVICYYFVRIFPVKAGLLGDEADSMVPQKPKWLDWLG